MKYVFKSLGSNSEFASWLKNFKEVQNSVLIEIDSGLGAFVAKVSTQDKDFVKFSQITFEKAGYEPVTILDNDGNPVAGLGEGKRLLWGIMNILPKVIEIVGMFGSVEHELTFDFDILRRGEDNPDFEFTTTVAEFKSKNLTMKTYGASYKEFIEIPDQVFFDVVYRAVEPVEVTVTPEIIKTILNVSAVMSQDPKTSTMKIYSKDGVDGQKEFHITDGADKDSYDYIIGYCSLPVQGNIAPVCIYRSNFIKATKGCDSEMTIIVGTQETDRILVDYDGGNTKAICAVVVR